VHGCTLSAADARECLFSTATRAGRRSGGEVEGASDAPVDMARDAEELGAGIVLAAERGKPLRAAAEDGR
jgi:hypothetical protein